MINEIKRFSDLSRSRSNVSTLKSKFHNNLNNIEEENQNFKPRSKSMDKINMSKQMPSKTIFKKRNND
jgi:hypothetical protein